MRLKDDCGAVGGLIKKFVADFGHQLVIETMRSQQ